MLRLFLMSLLSVSFIAEANQLSTLLQQGQQQLELGYYREAEKQFQQAQVLATEQQDIYSVTLLTGLRAYIALQRQQLTESEKMLNQALSEAQTQNWHNLTLRLSLYSAQLQMQKNQSEKAKLILTQAIANPERITEKSLLVSAYYQLANKALLDNNLSIAYQQLQTAQTLLKTLPENQQSSSLWLNLGYQQLRLYQLDLQPKILAQTYSSLQQALAQAKELNQSRVQASTLKHLAHLYTLQQRNGEAVKLLLAGINQAQQVDAEDILLELEWQLAQLYQNTNQLPQAIGAYRRAVRHIENIRIDIPVTYQQGRSSFRDTLAPIYLSLADLLLQQSRLKTGHQQQALLKEAQDTIELMKQSELEDYFQSRCEIAATPLDLQKTDPKAAAIYPIQLKDRLEIIVYTAQGLQSFSSKVNGEMLEKHARRFAKNLRSYSSEHKVKRSSRALYQWLIQPLHALLKEQEIETLVFMPDGALRLFPLGALYNGKKFLIEDYAVVVSPGMSLIESDTDMQKQARSILLAGMSIPGEVVKDLPDALLSNLVNSIDKRSLNQRTLTRDLTRAFRNVPQQALSLDEQQKRRGELRQILRQPVVLEQLQKILELPGVDAEIKRLAKQSQSPFLLNQSFSLANFTDTLIEKPYKTLHIASHGFFGSTAGESFIMTHDKILHINKLQELLELENFKKFPIDLITLSACQTAEGDDRSPLGIAGVAIKSKVQSALGSLWAVSDEATFQLMTQFYRYLNEENYTKASALRAAKLHLLNAGDFANPSVWSPFVLVGRWQ